MNRTGRLAAVSTSGSTKMHSIQQDRKTRFAEGERERYRKVTRLGFEPRLTVPLSGTSSDETGFSKNWDLPE